MISDRNSAVNSYETPTKAILEETISTFLSDIISSRSCIESSHYSMLLPLEKREKFASWLSKEIVHQTYTCKKTLDEIFVNLFFFENIIDEFSDITISSSEELISLLLTELKKLMPSSSEQQKKLTLSLSEGHIKTTSPASEDSDQSSPSSEDSDKSTSPLLENEDKSISPLSENHKKLTTALSKEDAKLTSSLIDDEYKPSSLLKGRSTSSLFVECDELSIPSDEHDEINSLEDFRSTEDYNITSSEWDEIILDARRLIKEIKDHYKIESSTHTPKLFKYKTPEPYEVDITQFDNISQLKKYINHLLTTQYCVDNLHNLKSEEEKMIFLKKMKFLIAVRKDAIHEFRSFVEIETAIKLFHDLNQFEKKICKIETDIKHNSFIRHLVNNPHENLSRCYLELKDNFKKFEHELYSHHFILGDYFANRIVKNKIKTYEAERDAINSNHFREYDHVIQNTKSKNVLQQIKYLFEDYYKKNSLRYLHWRHHDNEAKKIRYHLQKIMSSGKSQQEQINEAISLINSETAWVADNKSLAKENYHQSSFLRRSLFALKLLDGEHNKNAHLDPHINSIRVASKY